MCASLCYELANTLKVLQKCAESSHYYTKCYFYCVKQAKSTDPPQNDAFSEFGDSVNRDISHSMELDAIQKAVDCLLEIKDFEMAVLRIKIYINILEERIENFNNDSLGLGENRKIVEWRPIYKIFVRQWMNAQLTLLIVLLLQKRKEEASEILEALYSGDDNGWIAREFPFIYENVLPIFDALNVSCIVNLF